MVLIKTKTNYQWDKKQSSPEGEEEKDIDALIRQLQLMVKDIRDDIFQLNPTLFTTLPSASEDKRGSFVIKEEGSVADKLNICMRTAGGGFAFNQIFPFPASTTPTLIEDADQNTKIQTEESSDENIIRMDTAGTEVWKMSAAGERIMVKQPAFLAISSADQDSIATGSDVTKVLGNEVFDQGDDFSSNIFTAPVDGKYQLNWEIAMSNIDTATTYIIKVITSNITYQYFFDPSKFSADITGNWSFSASNFTNMDASDTALLAVNQVGGTQQTNLLNGHCRLSGFLAV